MVQAFNQDGIPSEIKQLTLIFLPKWYQTGWFRVIVFVLIAGGIYGFYRFRIHQLKQLQEVRNKLAGDLHDDLGSTMNSVKIYANLAIMEKHSDKYLHKVKESVQEAIIGIRDMIWVLDDKKDTFEHLLTRISTFATPVYEANQVLFDQQITDDARGHKLAQEERRNLYMIMKESINNVLKYAQASQVQIEVSLKKGKPLIIIKDNGQGFDTCKTTEGNGLKNMARRAGEIRYQLQIGSGPGNGTAIQLQKM
jgi:signal transduction histidine kinase